MIITCIILYIIIQYLILDYVNKTEDNLPIWICCLSAIFIPGLFLTTVVEILKEYQE